MPEYINEVQINIKSGEDYTSQIIWRSDEDEPIPVTGPARMEIRDKDMNLLVYLDQDEEEQAENKGYIGLSKSSGTISLFIPKYVTFEMPTGTHFFDLFCNYDRVVDPLDNAPTWGNYHVRAPISGIVVVHPHITQNIPPHAT